MMSLWVNSLIEYLLSVSSYFEFDFDYSIIQIHDVIAELDNYFFFIIKFKLIGKTCSVYVRYF